MTADPENAVRFHVSTDKMSAALQLLADLDPDSLSVDGLADLACQQGVRIDEQGRARIADLIERYRDAPDRDHEAVVAEGVPPVHGVDGRFDFEPGLDPNAGSGVQPSGASQTNEGDGDGGVDHYSRSVLPTVRAGQAIGVIVDPTPGDDGHDVTGRCLTAKQGKPVNLRRDETTRVQSGGVVVAAIGGVIEHHPPMLRVVQEVDIRGNVDFSTGNVHFEGDVTIERGVRDCFRVQASGDITVRGLVEASHLAAGVDVHLEGGMAGRAKGTVTSGRDVHARYLDDVHVMAGRDLIIEREAMNCRLDVTRRLVCETGTVAGGVISAPCACVIGQLGVPSGVETEVILGRIAELEDLAEQVGRLLPHLRRRVEQAEQVCGSAAGLGVRAQAQRCVTPLIEQQRRIADLIARHTEIDLLVARQLHGGVRLYVGTLVAEFLDSIKGPVRILRDESGELIIRDESNATTAPLGHFARVKRHETYTGPVLARLAAPSFDRAA